MKTRIQIKPASDRNVPDEWLSLARTAGFKVARLARIAGVSTRTLQRHFRAEYRVTVSEWLTQARLKEASQRIKAGDRVKAVAMDLGYKQLSHFSREFKRVYGLPPSRVPVPLHKA